jgi:hypothetical protein
MRLLAYGLAGVSCLVTATVGAQAAPVRVTAGLGVVYIHQPAFTFTRGMGNPRQLDERESDGAGLSFGGGLEAVGAQWWGGIGAQWLVSFFEQGNTVIATAHAGRVLPHVLGGTLRIGLGPVLVRAERRERTLTGCLTDCTPVVYPPALATGGFGVALVQEWCPWNGIRIGLEGQVASGAQRFAGGRLRIALGS